MSSPRGLEPTPPTSGEPAAPSLPSRRVRPGFLAGLATVAGLAAGAILAFALGGED